MELSVQSDTQAAATTGACPPKRLKHGKRHTLARLAANWREAIFFSIASMRLKAAVAVLAASGCRPSELERGVIVQITDGHLRLGISGSKVDEATGRGQPRRGIIIDASTPWGQLLHELADQQSNQICLVNYDAQGISQRLREKSRELWPRRKTLVSAYSFRHFIGQSLKESGYAADVIAKVLGHASDHAQSVYGRAGPGKKAAGQHGIIEARVTNPIRHSKKMDRLLRFENKKEILAAAT